MADHYQNNIYHQGGEDRYGTYGEGGDHGGYGYQADYPPQEEDAASDVTEGHDEEDQMYEGEYQGIPHPDEEKAAQRAARAKSREGGSAASELEELSEQYEDIMEDCGHGKFQWTLFIVLGLALMADGVECYVVAFALPSAEKDLCLSNAEKGMLGLVVFLSMMVGAFLWGGLADKTGRRRCLILALAINCIFAFLSSFAQGYGFFLFFRLLSGIGIGGTVPIVYSYFSEFLQMDKRGEHLSWLCMFWMIGGIYASFTAWGIIPRYGWGFSMGTEIQFHSWRVFVLVAALPAIASLVGLTFMPESPRFLLEHAKHDEAWMILKQVHDTNWRAKGQPEKVFTVTHIKAPKTAEDEFIEIQSATGTPVQRWAVRSLTLCKLVLRNIASLLSAELRFATLFMAVIWFCMAFSYYGLSVWFPDMIKHLQYEEYKAKVKTFHRERVENFHFNFSLENQIHKEGEYIRDRFIDIEMKSVRFEDSLFEECHFEDIWSTDTVFKNCTIRSTLFYNTDLWEEKFIDCRMENTTFEHNKQGCHLDMVEENDVLIYLVSFLGSLAVLPGNIISALFVEKIGRVKIIGGSMLISACCSFFLFLSFSQSAIIALQCMFCAVSAAAWNGIEVVTVELYPTSKRATAFGVLNALCKLAAILGSSIFASFVGITKAIPILLSFTALVCGGLVALRLPDTRQKILQ
ncbi:synaptic vesicle glycoprotein 2B-like [Girardinichthys multiradiatus]|nr:synaptic vesicle glycoprotein 2B-like [Girardinichthys multiradiatus]XP_047200731.1 synaptic vesicle glycoprotein 2B-like [Girardinichthys multiradiatus]XP_047200741.1 synaptic vesicle glycoprotein 2B-like [Girardinichthys multiradiatus]